MPDQWNMLVSDTGPALMPGGGSLCTSRSSMLILFRAMMMMMVNRVVVRWSIGDVVLKSARVGGGVFYVGDRARFIHHIPTYSRADVACGTAPRGEWSNKVNVEPKSQKKMKEINLPLFCGPSNENSELFAFVLGTGATKLSATCTTPRTTPTGTCFPPLHLMNLPFPPPSLLSFALHPLFLSWLTSPPPLLHNPSPLLFHQFFFLTILSFTFLPISLFSYLVIYFI